MKTTFYVQSMMNVMMFRNQWNPVYFDLSNNVVADGLLAESVYGENPNEN